MKGLAATKLRSFHEVVLGTEVRVFGNVAVALAACQMTENEGVTARSRLVVCEGTLTMSRAAWSWGHRSSSPCFRATSPRKWSRYA